MNPLFIAISVLSSSHSGSQYGWTPSANAQRKALPCARTERVAMTGQFLARCVSATRSMTTKHRPYAVALVAIVTSAKTRNQTLLGNSPPDFSASRQNSSLVLVLRAWERTWPAPEHDPHFVGEPWKRLTARALGTEWEILEHVLSTEDRTVSD